MLQKQRRQIFPAKVAYDSDILERWNHCIIVVLYSPAFIKRQKLYFYYEAAATFVETCFERRRVQQNESGANGSNRRCAAVAAFGETCESLQKYEEETVLSVGTESHLWRL
ncbi:hypothetical protein e1116g03.tmp0091 [Eimeria tenella]|uniref:Uncharacterized protein n=1 Tax=Eimeria tenella TaxID=5802 RepID=C8TE42_EIMTE|nr:hypothetical protein e1116g03.tmp0091 [Eimeria tenella]